MHLDVTCFYGYNGSQSEADGQGCGATQPESKASLLTTCLGGDIVTPSLRAVMV